MAAAQYSFDRFHDGTITLSSGSAHAVTVPGALSAWETLLRPAIGFAENGWAVPARVSRNSGGSVPAGGGLLAPRSGMMLHDRGLESSGRAEPSEPYRARIAADAHGPAGDADPGRTRGDAVRRQGRAFSADGQTLFSSNLIGHGLDIEEVLDLPRLFPFGGRVEAGMPDAVVSGLAAPGHDPFVMAVSHGGGQAIWTDRARGVLVGGSDRRKDGMALGH